MITMLSIGASYMNALLSSGGASTGSITDILKFATEMFTWFLESMGDLVNFIFSHPAILFWFLVAIVGAVLGMFFRIWHST